MIFCTWMVILAKCCNIPFYLGLKPLTIWMNIHVGFILLIKIYSRPPLNSSSTHTTHSGNLPNIIIQRRSSLEPSISLDTGSYSIIIVLSWRSPRLSPFFTQLGFHRGRVKLSCLFLQVQFRYSRKILEWGEACTGYFYYYAWCEIMMYIGDIPDEFQMWML